MNMLLDVALLLQSKSIGTFEQDIFLSGFPDFDSVPDDAIALFDYAGLPVDNADSDFRQLSMQVCTRSTGYTSALERAEVVSAALKDIGNTVKELPHIVLNNTIYFKFAALQHPFKLREDDKGRIYFAQNFRVQAKPISKL